MAFRIAVFAVLLLGSSVRAASAADVLYYSTVPLDAPKEQRVEFKDLDGEPVFLAKEPVAKVSGDSVKEARIVRDEVEVLDEDDPVNAIYRVTLVLDEAESAKLAATMASLCKSKAGLAVVVDGVVMSYAPFTVCERIEVVVGFTEKGAAEKFAHQVARQVSIVTPSSP